MTQDRRITDKLPGQPLDWSDTASPASNKAAADLTSQAEQASQAWGKDQIDRGVYFTDARRQIYRDGYLAALLAAPAEEAKPVAYMTRDGKHLIFAGRVVSTTDLSAAQAIALGYQPLYTRAAPAAQPDELLERYRALEQEWNALMDALACEDTASAVNVIEALKSAATTTSQPDEARDAVAARGEVDWEWCHSYPRDAAAEINRLRAAPTAASPSHPEPKRKPSSFSRHSEYLAYLEGYREAHPVQQQEQGDELAFTAELDCLLGAWADAAEGGVTSHEIIREKIVAHVRAAQEGR